MKRYLNWLIVLFYFYGFVLADKRNLFLHYRLNFVPGDFSTDSRYSMFGLVVSAILGIILLIVFRFKKQKKGDLKIKSLFPSMVISMFLMFFSKPTIKWTWVLFSEFILIVGLFLTIKTVNIFLKTKKFWWKFLSIIIISTPFLVLFHSIEMVGRIKTPMATIYTICGLTLIISFLGNLFISFFYKKRKIDTNYLDIFWMTLTIAYVFLPLIHFVFMTPMSTKYITNWDNFLAKNFCLQILIIGIHYMIIKFCFTKNNKLKQ